MNDKTRERLIELLRKMQAAENSQFMVIIRADEAGPYIDALREVLTLNDDDDTMST